MCWLMLRPWFLLRLQPPLALDCTDSTTANTVAEIYTIVYACGVVGAVTVDTSATAVAKATGVIMNADLSSSCGEDYAVALYIPW